ncbi:MAG: hypothetical protein OXI48_05050 [bacterium]|nr:hypothetical protein [bacterium]
MTITESHSGSRLLSRSWPDTAADGPTSGFLADVALHSANSPALTWVAAERRRAQPRGLSASWAYEKILALRSLRDDWDGHGGLSPSGEALACAYEFLVTLETWPPHALRPDVMASTEGGVLVEWDADDVEVIIEIPPRGGVNVYFKTARAEVEGPVEDHLADLSEALSHVVRQT